MFYSLLPWERLGVSEVDTAHLVLRVVVELVGTLIKGVFS